MERFADRVRDYDAEVRRVTADDVAAAVAGACAEMGLRRVVIPPGLSAEWRPPEIEAVEDDGLTAGQIDEIDGALTGCAVAIAETGTLILDGQGASGRRLVTLVPDHHVCVVAADQIHDLVPEAVDALAASVRAARSRRSRSSPGRRRARTSSWPAWTASTDPATSRSSSSGSQSCRRTPASWRVRASGSARIAWIAGSRSGSVPLLPFIADCPIHRGSGQPPRWSGTWRSCPHRRAPGCPPPSAGGRR